MEIGRNRDLGGGRRRGAEVSREMVRLRRRGAAEMFGDAGVQLTAAAIGGLVFAETGNQVWKRFQTVSEGLDPDGTMPRVMALSAMFSRLSVAERKVA